MVFKNARNFVEKRILFVLILSSYHTLYFYSFMHQSNGCMLNSVRSATGKLGDIMSMLSLFQSTHSMRSATADIRPRATRKLFQSTHSMRSATETSSDGDGKIFISIHALHAECDQLKSQRQNRTARFQSTHSMRSATAKAPGFQADRKNFNPRTPCGVRHDVLPESDRIHSISIHALHAECD